jgi:hypothetical protein
MALVLNLMVLLTESESSGGGDELNPWVVGAVALGILLAALLAVVAIGGGRDHT